MKGDLHTRLSDAESDPICQGERSWLDDIFDQASPLPARGARKPNADEQAGALEDWA